MHSKQYITEQKQMPLIQRQCHVGSEVLVLISELKLISVLKPREVVFCTIKPELHAINTHFT